MRKISILVLIACIFAAFVVLAQPMSQSPQFKLPDDLTNALTRPSVLQIGGWTKIDCSNVAAATSAQLNAWSRYVIQCGDDSYIATGDAVTDLADANDGWLPSGAWLEFITTDSVRFISCLNKTVDSDCRIWEGL